VHPKEFNEVELILQKILLIQKDHSSKSTPNYEGSYVVKKNIFWWSTNSHKDGWEVNANMVKKLYA